MSLNISQKKQVVKDVSAVVGTAQATVIAEYRGMTVEQMKVLRREAHDSGVYLRVVKNTLLRRAVIHAWMTYWWAL